MLFTRQICATVALVSDEKQIKLRVRAAAPIYMHAYKYAMSDQAHVLLPPRPFKFLTQSSWKLAILLAPTRGTVNEPMSRVLPPKLMIQAAYLLYGALGEIILSGHGLC